LQYPASSLAADEVHVWRARLDIPQPAADSLLNLLNPEEQDRAAKFKFPDPRNIFVISRAFLRSALGAYLKTSPRELRFWTTSHGKPELTGHPDLRFNLSHTEGMAVLGIVRQREIGIDVESLTREVNTLELADRFFSAVEAKWVRSQPESEQTRAFLYCWTAKEAYVKAHGEGLSLPLDGFSVIPTLQPSPLHLDVFGDASESARWSMWQLEMPAGFCAALGVEGGGYTLRYGDWPAFGQ
jgi:4'-phosphopantetheinyl transferase